MTTATYTSESVFRVDDVALKFECTPQTIYNLISRGDLRAMRVGRLLRIPQSAIDEFINAGK